MKRSGANEDTSSLPVISALDAELTYLQKGGQDPYPPKKSGAFPFGETRFSGSDERNSTCYTCQLCSCSTCGNADMYTDKLACVHVNRQAQKM